MQGRLSTVAPLLRAVVDSCRRLPRAQELHPLRKISDVASLQFQARETLTNEKQAFSSLHDTAELVRGDRVKKAVICFPD